MSDSEIIPQISVVIPSYNHADELIVCLQTIFQQKTEIMFEVIVSDSSEKNFASRINSKFPQVQFIHHNSRKSPGEARNEGVVQAKAKLLAFVDSDCTVDKNWISNIFKAHKSGYDVICGGIRNGYKKSLTATAEYFMECGEYIPERESTLVDMFPAGNLSIKKTLFEEVGGFPDLLASEDDLLSYNLKQRDVQIFFDNSIVITHFQRTKLKLLWKKQQNLGVGFFKSRKMYQLKGYQLTNNRIFTFGIPLLRMFMIWKKVLRGGIKYSWKLFLTSPFILFGLIAYSVGFWKAFAVFENSYENKNKSIQNHKIVQL